MATKSNKIKKILLISAIVMLIILFLISLPFIILWVSWTKTNTPERVKNSNMRALVAEIRTMDEVYRVKDARITRWDSIDIYIFVTDSFTEVHTNEIINLAEKHIYGDKTLFGDVWFYFQNKDGSERNRVYFDHLP